MREGTINVFILKEDMNAFMNESNKVQFWTSKPSNYNSEDLMQVSITLETYNRMVNERMGGKDSRQLLKD